MEDLELNWPPFVVRQSFQWWDGLRLFELLALSEATLAHLVQLVLFPGTLDSMQRKLPAGGGSREAWLPAQQESPGCSLIQCAAAWEQDSQGQAWRSGPCKKLHSSLQRVTGSS